MTYEELLEKCRFKNAFGGIYLGDCVEGMKLLDDKSIDVCFTSPPYNDSGNGSHDVSDCWPFHTKYLTKEKYYNDEDGYYNWQCEVIDQMLRVTKKYILYNIQGIKNNRKSLYRIIGKYADRIHDILIWYKPNGQPTSTPNAISNTYEYVIIFKPDGVKSVKTNSTFFRNVIVENVHRNPFCDIHRAVMNKNVSDTIIGEFAKEGDIVLDPFMGMGTTALSCMEQNKKFLGFEICDTYLDKSGERLNEFLNKKPETNDLLE